MSNFVVKTQSLQPSGQADNIVTCPLRTKAESATRLNAGYFIDCKILRVP